MPTLIAMRSFLQQLTYLLRDIIDAEAEMREYIGGLAGSAELIDPQHPAARADVTPPALRGAGLDRQAARHGARQHALAVARILCVESLGRGHRHKAHAMPGGVQTVDRLRREADLRAGRDH